MSHNFTCPDKGCALCPRLVDFLNKNRTLYPDFFNGPVPSFGSLDAHLLVVGLAPGLRGANKSGRPFTGDFAGDLLYPNLIEFGYAKGNYKAKIDDGIELIDARITNAVRCVPPENKPTGDEARQCGKFLADEINDMQNLRVILTLGGLAHNAVLSVLGAKKSKYKFAHNTVHEIDWNGRKITILNTYHSSRYNVNTGRLTPEMFVDVFKTLSTLIPR